MYYPEEVVEEVRSRNDIVSVISQVVNLQKKGGRYFGLCPFHNEKTGSFSVSEDKQLYHCFGCSASGNVISFVMAYENFGFMEAVEYLADRAGMELPKQSQSAEAKKQSDKKAKMLALYKDAATFYYMQLRAPIGEKAKAYFDSRALTDETQNKFGLGYAPQSSQPIYTYLKSKGYTDELIKEAQCLKIEERGVYDPFWNRAIFPIMDIRNRVIGFGGRVMGDGNPKYLNSGQSPIFDKSRNLYALNLAKSSRRNYMILCEGYMDVIALHQAGFDCAVASLGTAFTSGHASLIKRYVEEVYLSFDSDEAGTKAKLRAIPILKGAGLSVKVIDLRPHKDPDEFIKALGVEAFEERISSALNSFFFETDVMASEHNLDDPESKTQFHKKLAAKLAGFTDALERDNYLSAVSKRYDIPADYLKEMVNYIGSRGMQNVDREMPTLTGAGVGRVVRGRGATNAEYTVLNWVIESDKSYEDIVRFIRPEYFSNECTFKVASYVFEQKKEGKKVQPAALLDVISADEDERAEIANILSAEVLGEDDEVKSVLSSNIKMLKRDYINRALRTETDGAKISEMAIAKANLDREQVDIL